MAAESDVVCEMEVLQSIYLDELQVKKTNNRGWEVSLELHPSTAEDSMSQFVRLTLTLTLDQQYPSSSPIISIHNPRGLSDDKLSSVQKCLQLEAQSCLGSPVLYQLIEKAKEILTESNIPHGNCVICLYGFKEGEAFTKTSCYHYFHSHCLGRYASHSEEEILQREKELEEDKTRERDHAQELAVVCPVCREPLTYDLDQLLLSTAPRLPELDEAAISADFQQKWAELQRLLDRQRSRGGIIDPEVESNRFLIHINEAPPGAEDENPDPDTSVEPPPPFLAGVLSEEAAAVRMDHVGPGLSHCRGGQGHRRHQRMQGPRRGSRSRPQRGRAAAVTEQLDHLSLLSDRTNRPTAGGALGTISPREQEDAESTPRNSLREVHAEKVSINGQPASLESEFPRDSADSVGSQAPRERRRGQHRSAGHASRSRGRPSNVHYRGDWSHRGHGRGFQRRMEDLERAKETL